MKSIFAALLIFGSISIASAQQRGGFGGNPEERAKAQVEQLTKELKLNDTQKDSVEKWVTIQSKKQQELFSQGQQGNREGMREQFTALAGETDTKILSILDDEQKEAYKKIQAERANRRGPGGGGRPGRNR